ncbi:hypothetical protein HMPREF1325_0303 [Treponema socranskii subsp. socranskii VPI DR56BR1116 = ATCC 35536]|uniref:Uncharacterized protein n=1 Tax=Treponema socranskii subsp. socranskii VPI DR56BR1116 = ATCC 35536 TaxID=1125725 RepID=U1GVN8_TRESO|nr:hypothetical protein HMPREF1325_0303 [Treponema socranskii subsp. socranskii VPI DR56BR1116 = ATCC 35536]
MKKRRVFSQHENSLRSEREGANSRSAKSAHPCAVLFLKNASGMKYDVLF